MSFLTGIFRKNPPVPAVAPPLPGEWDEPAVMAWLDTLSARGERHEPSTTFTWTTPFDRAHRKTGTVFEWAIESRATAVIRRLLSDEGVPSDGGRHLVKKLIRSGRVDHPENVAIATLLSEAGAVFKVSDLEWALFGGGEEVSRFLTPLLAATGSLPSSLAARAASVGAPDSLMDLLIRSGLRFDREDLTMNIAFQSSAGDTDTRGARVSRWLSMLAAHDAAMVASSLDEGMPKPRPPATSRSRF